MPEETEFKGISNLVTAVSRYSDVGGKTLYGCLPSFQDSWRQWGALDDVVRKYEACFTGFVLQRALGLLSTTTQALKHLGEGESVICLGEGRCVVRVLVV